MSVTNPFDEPYPLTAAQTSSFRERGWAFLPGLVPRGLVDELRQIVINEMGSDLEGNYRGIPRLLKPKAGDAKAADFELYGTPSADHPQFAALSLSRRMESVCAGLGRPDRYRLYRDVAVVKRPTGRSGGATGWHQDAVFQPQFDRTSGMTVWIALTDVPPEMGSLKFLNGSHAAGSLGRVGEGTDVLREHPWLDQYPRSDPLTYQPGDATAHGPLVVHGAGENNAEDFRWAYALEYVAHDVRYTGAPNQWTDGMGLAPGDEFDCLPLVGESLPGV